MKKLLISLIAMLITVSYSYSQSNCIYCGENMLEKTASAIGNENTNLGEYSLVIGTGNYIQKGLKTATLIGNHNSIPEYGMGKYSIALGNENLLTNDSSIILGNYNELAGINSFILGTHSQVSSDFSASIGYKNIANGVGSLIFGNFCEASSTYSTAIGMYANSSGMAAISIGNYSESKKSFSYTFGTKVIANAPGAMVLGGGLDYTLQNNENNSLMVGFGSDVPTFFVGESSGSGMSGRIGIGNITTPEAKLHIKADNDEDASLLLQPTGSNYFGKLMLGDENHSISSRTDENLEFKTQTDKDFVFKNGSIFIEDQFSGLILKSPDGQCWKRTVDNNGSFVIENINCNLMTNEKKNPEAPQQTARIFPNPASHKLSIELSSGIPQAYARFYNESGILLLQKELRAGSNSISLRKMPLGVLVVRVSDEKGNLLSVEKVMHQ